MSATFLKKLRKNICKRDKTLSLSVFIAVPLIQKGYVFKKTKKDDARQVKIEKRNSVHLNEAGHFCAILIEIINEPIC
jgi:hypothetical protein